MRGMKSRGENVGRKSAVGAQLKFGCGIQLCGGLFNIFGIPDFTQRIADPGLGDKAGPFGIVGRGRTAGGGGEKRDQGYPQHTEN